MPLSVVIDTNILLVSLSDRSPYYWLFEALQQRRYKLYVSTPIVLEYEEIVASHMGRDAARDMLEVLKRSPNVHRQDLYYRWHLIEADPDDNKFVDCALASGADHIVTHDRHFDVLRDRAFPKVSVITAKVFRKLLE